MSGVYSRRGWVCAMLLALWSSVAGATETSHPLEPPDLSSPRATLNHFLTTGDAMSEFMRDRYWHAPSRALVDQLERLEAEREGLFDLSEIPPAARSELVRDGIHYLYDVLSRIELPPEAEIPDAAVFEDAVTESEESGEKTASWTIPHTEITLVRIEDGVGAGKFVFSSSTLARAEEFYNKARTLPYRRDVPLEDYVEMRPYLSFKSWFFSSRTIESFPDWLKQSVLDQALWKWIALAAWVIASVVLVAIVHRLMRNQRSGDALRAQLARVATPLTLLLIPLTLDQMNRALTLTGWVSGGVVLVAKGVTFLALAWIIWATLIAIAEAIIASPKIPNQGLNASLLRLIARTTGIVIVTAIVLYVSNQLGAPLYSLVAGLGVGGLALALAVRPTLENIIGSLTLFADKPVRVGDYCRFGNEYGTVEEIGMRSIRLRKQDDTIVTLPNADFSQREITNYSRRRCWLYETRLGLRYETSPEQLRYVMAKLREMLHGHPKVSSDSLHVRFGGFGAYSLDIVLFAYIRTRDWLSYRAIREDINLRIMDIIEEAGTCFAFPTQTAYLGRDPGLDVERGKEAETQVQAWRAEGQLPFPDFDQDQYKEKEDILDYPPKGSPGYKAEAQVSELKPKPSGEHGQGQVHSLAEERKRPLP